MIQGFHFANLTINYQPKAQINFLVVKLSSHFFILTEIERKKIQQRN